MICGQTLNTNDVIANYQMCIAWARIIWKIYVYFIYKTVVDVINRINWCRHGNTKTICTLTSKGCFYNLQYQWCVSHCLAWTLLVDFECLHLHWKSTRIISDIISKMSPSNWHDSYNLHLLMTLHGTSNRKYRAVHPITKHVMFIMLHFPRPGDILRKQSFWSWV